MEETGKKLDLIRRYFGDFTAVQWRQWAALDPLYREWNERINIISRKDLDSLYEKHVLHSLSIAAVFEFDPGARILDLGTGGGFPGIPLAIFFPEVQFHLVDSIGKKIKVVRAIAESLALRNVTATQTRAEELKGARYDFVVSRAVAPLADLWKWSRPLLKKKSGHASDSGLICLKGGDLQVEISRCSCRPKLIPVQEIFDEPWFEEKYLLYVSA